MVTASSLRPGDEGVIDVTFVGKGKSGPQEKTITVLTNDPDHETVVLTIRAMVLTDFACHPETADLGTVKWNQSASTTVDLIIRDPESLSIGAVDTSVRQVSCEVQSKIDDTGREIPSSLKISIQPGLPLGKIRQRVLIQSTSEEVPVLEIPVTGMIIGDITLEPRAVTFHGLNPESLEVHRIDVKIRTTGADFQITGMEDPTGLLATRLTTLEPGREYAIEISPHLSDSGTFPSQFNGLITIHTDNPRQPVLELPVYGTRGKDSGALTVPGAAPPSPPAGSNKPAQ